MTPGSMPATPSTQSTMETDPARGPAVPLCFDRSTGLLQRKAFADPTIFEMEMSGIFRRSWLFVGPGHWLARSGDFVTTRMGAEPVIVWRGEDGTLRVFVNRCVASHQQVCSEPRGWALQLACPCHHWLYNSHGQLLGEPPHALGEIARVSQYKGLLFANRDPDAAPLADWLGHYAGYLDLILDRRPGGVEAYGHDAFRWTIDANWKLPVDAFCGDIYRDMPLSSTSLQTSRDSSSLPQQRGFQVFTGNGAMSIMTGQGKHGRTTNAHSPMGEPYFGFEPILGSLFPNLSFDWRAPSLHVWHPLSPSRTEIHSYCLVDAAAPAWEKEAARRAFQFQYGPAGLRSERDAALWRSITSRSAGRNDYAYHLCMGLGRERRTDLPGTFGDLVSESNQRAFFDWWQRRLGKPQEASGEPHEALADDASIRDKV
jgi:3-phenylpropionate/trans-cinnamate dioxygenase alpha subunit